MQWWVVNHPSGGPRQVMMTNYVVTESGTRPVNAVAGPFATKAEAQAWQTSANTAGNSPGSVVGGVTNAAVSATGLNAIGAFFTKLGQASIWLRVAEVVLGLVLVAVGMARVVPSFTPAQMIAKKVGVKL
jgi:hypothetical protein